MNLVRISLADIRIKHPLPFDLMNIDGVLIARKEFTIESMVELEEICGRAGGLYINFLNTETHLSKFMGQVHGILPDEEITEGTDIEDRKRPDWVGLQEQCDIILRDCNPAKFLGRLESLHDIFDRNLRINPDGVLFALMYMSANDARRYSSTHSMLVSAMCLLAAREVLSWSKYMQTVLFKSAITMNLSMTDMQDRLAMQSATPTPEQKLQISNHAARSTDMLSALGVNDPVWLQAVCDHHTQRRGPMSGKTEAQCIARLIQRADMFAARLAPRISRYPRAPATAMQACYFDEECKVDEAGAALIKAVGIYPPGTFVRLATNEIAIVVKRRMNTAIPKVAVLVNRLGIATSEPVVRETKAPENRIIASVPHREVKVHVNFEKILPLTVT